MNAVFNLLTRSRLHIAWAKANDFYLGIDSDEDPASAAARQDNSARHIDSHPYQAADYRNIRRVVRILDPGPDDVAYDIGCGKGRFLSVIAQRPLRRVVGIELNATLCAIARKNAERLRNRRSPIDVFCQDAAEADLTDGTVYFLYNPFGPATMRSVLEKIQCSLLANPRVVRMVYYNAEFEEVWHACSWLQPFAEFKTFTGKRVTFWHNRPT